MKKIFSFLLAFVVALSFTGNLLAQDVHVKSGAKVRYMIEKKTVTQNEADTYASQGYVDLWAYALFNVGYWEKSIGGDDLIVNSGGAVSEWYIQFTPPTHSFMICDKNGDYKTSGSILFSQPAAQSTCGTSRIPKQRAVTNGLQDIQFIRQVCPTYAYGNSPANGSSAVGAQSYIDRYTDDNGTEWYRMKLYTIRYDYSQAVTFNTRFWSSYEQGNIPPSNLVESPGASTFTLSYAGNPIKGSDSWNWADQDWQNHLRFNSNDLFGFVIGGVEVIADPEFSLVAGATCNGSDLTGTFKVSDWASKSWKDYRAVRMYVSTGGVRRDVSAQTAVSPSLPLGDASTAGSFSYSLAPAAYLTAGVPADSLIWAIEDIKNNLI